MADQTENSDPWGTGLADLLAVELQKQAVPILERRSIRLVLAERRLARMGLSDWQRLVQQKLPQVQYLISGEMRRVTDLHYHLTVSVTDVRSGREVASLDHHGAYPRDLFTGVPQLATQVAERVKQGPSLRILRRKPAPALAAWPETALPLYKGIEHCLAGRPEWAAVYFMEAQNAGATYPAAQIWKLRAFQMLGIPEYVQACRDELSSFPEGAKALARFDKRVVPPGEKQHVALMTEPDSAGSPAVFTALKHELQKRTELSVFDPRSIENLSREMDLQLSENPGDTVDLATMNWTAVDAVLRCRLSQAADAPTLEASQQLSIEAHDAVSGALLFSVQSPARPFEVPQLVQKLVQALRKPSPSTTLPDGSAAAGYRETKVPYDTLRLPGGYWTNRAYRAALLKAGSQFPKDRRVILRSQTLFGGQEWLNKANWNRYVNAINPADPRAATRLAAALWSQTGFYSRTLVVEDFKLLLERYPESLEAQNARSALALEAFRRKEYDEAILLWTNVFAKLPQLAPAGLVTPGYWAQAYFFTAASFYESKRPAEADSYLQKAEALLRAHPDMPAGGSVLATPPMDDSIEPRWICYFREDEPYYGPEKTLREAIVTLRQQLSQGTVQPDPSQASYALLERLLKEADECDGEAARNKDLEFIQTLIRHKQANPLGYDGSTSTAQGTLPMRQVSLGYTAMGGNFPLSTKLVFAAMGKINQLIRLARSADERKQIEQFATELAKDLKPLTAAQCYQASGQYEQALALTEAQLRQKPSYDGIMLKRMLLRAASGPVASADYLLSQFPTSNQVVRVIDPHTLARETAIDFQTAGLYDRASRAYEQAITSQPSLPEPYRLSAQLRQAECEFRAGNEFEATELLRKLLKTTEGKGYRLAGETTVGTESTELYSLSVRALQKMRFLNEMKCRRFDWEIKPAFDLFAPIPPPAPLSTVDADLRDLLLRAFLRRTTNSYEQGISTDDFVKKHGRAAVPAVLKMLTQRLIYPNEMGLIGGILDHVATVEDASAILDAFRHFPELAPVALRLDPQAARSIIAEQFPVYYQMSTIPSSFNYLIAKHKLRETYPTLIANFAESQFAFAFEAQTIDRFLTNDPEPQAIEAFRQALSQRLTKLFTSRNQHQIGTLGLIAIKYGVIDGLEAVLRGQDVPREKIVGHLRPYFDLPSNDAAALQWLETHRGQFTWNLTRKRYETKKP